MVAKAQQYIDGGWRLVDKVPTIAGMACELDVSRETLRLWGKDKDHILFGILGRVMRFQERELVNSGLDGTFKEGITKMMLSKHGYADSVEQTVFSVNIEGDDANL